MNGDEAALWEQQVIAALEHQQHQIIELRKHLPTAMQQQTRMECLKLAIGISCTPNAAKPARGDDVARVARTFEDYLRGKMPVAEVTTLVVPEGTRILGKH